MIRFDLANYQSLRFILENLCEMDRTELLATAWNEDRLADDLAGRIMQGNVFAMVAWDVRPITAFGIVPMSPGVGVAFAFSTKEYRRAIIPVTRFIRRIVIPKARANYHRIECRALARPQADRWMSLIDAKPEATLKCFGKQGQDFVLYRWLRDEHAHQARAA